MRSENLFLSALPDDDFNRLKPHLEYFDGKIGDLLNSPNEPVSYVYFPLTAVISLVTFLEDGSNIETGIVGREGFAGLGAILSDDVSPRETTVQVAGEYLRIKANIFKAEFECGGALQKLALRFVFAFIAQISQNAACNNRHRVDVRLARWLLSLHDRKDTDDIRITQEFVAQMLGVNRPTVSECASKLQAQNLITYSRGRIIILDKEGLEKTTCECYRTIKTAYDKYLLNNGKRKPFSIKT